MDWRYQNQTDVSAFLTTGGTYTDAQYPRDVALEFVDSTSYYWHRAQDRCPASAGYSLWGAGGFDYDSLNQGYLGDCWFLSAL
jgi:hypothetical protein